MKMQSFFIKKPHDNYFKFYEYIKYSHFILNQQKEYFKFRKRIIFFRVENNSETRIIQINEAFFEFISYFFRKSSLKAEK
jgi:hypothetical protein